ncbi:alpha/beta fold hydrolase [Actinoplanes sp. CA-142083]|uniref:alpha/beta fold hydrolase n=1 Tax=Actinoplanes sp. CA-142083 TaxID=3239903 RepID=UPI003D917270
MHIVHDGARDAPPLLLIHGSGASGASWELMVPALAERHHVIRVDLPGCGKSPEAPSYAVAAQASAVAAVLDEGGLSRVAVAGHSSGGYVATALAEQRPDLVGSLALVSTGPSPAALLPQPLILKVLLGPPLGRLVWAVRSDARIRKGAAATAARPIEVPDEMVADIRAINYRTMRAVLRCNLEYLTARDVPARLGALDVPVLAICGGADRRWDPASAREYLAVPGARVEVLPGVGHVPLLEAPEDTSRLLQSFIAQPEYRPESGPRA